MKSILQLLILVFISACVKPIEALEKGKYHHAFRLAKRQVKQNKNIEQNIEILKISGAQIVAQEIDENANLIATNQTKNLIKVQNNYYNLLTKIGKVNIDVQGEISDVYDVLCTEKKELDFKIADNYYQAGWDFLDQFYVDWQKAEARKAYYKFKDCRKYDGDLFFKNITDLMTEAHNRGTVYYIGDDYRNSYFFKRLPLSSQEEPDCDIAIDHGPVRIWESESTHTDHYSKNIQVGTRTETDTLGKTIIIPIYEEIHASITITDIIVTASISTNVSVLNLSGQCSVKSNHFTTQVNDNYQEVSVHGDRRSISGYIPSSSSSISIWILESRLYDEIEYKLR